MGLCIYDFELGLLRVNMKYLRSNLQNDDRFEDENMIVEFSCDTACEDTQIWLRGRVVFTVK